jgi:hypothetical protein
MTGPGPWSEAAIRSVQQDVSAFAAARSGLTDGVQRLLLDEQHRDRRRRGELTRALARTEGVRAETSAASLMSSTVTRSSQGSGDQAQSALPGPRDVA